MFQGSLLVIVVTINGSRKNVIVKAAFELQSSRAPKEYILQWFTQENHQRDKTHCLNHKSYLHFTHNVTFALTSKHARESI